MLTFVLTAFPITAQSGAGASVGGEAEYRIEGLIPRNDPGATTSEHHIELTTRLSAGSEIGELSAAVTTGRNLTARSRKLSLEQAQVSAFFGNLVVADLGLFRYQPAVADLLPSHNFFARRNYPAFFTGRLQDAALAAPLFRVNVGGFRLFASATLLPVMLEVPFVSTDSPWFPNLGFPEEIDVSSPVSQTLTLDEIIVEAYPEATGHPAEASFELAGGVTAGPVDLALRYYNGQDLRPLYAVSLDPDGLSSPYDIYLRPIYRRIHALAASALAVIGPVRLYTEQTLRLNDAVIVREFTNVATRFETLVYRTPSYTPLIGASYTARGVPIVASAEYRNAAIINPVDRMLEPLLDHAAAVSVLWRPWNGRLTATAFGLVSIPDGSTNSSLRLELTSRSRAMSVQLTVPIFWGAAGTELGQYADTIAPSLSLTYRF